MNKRKKNRWRNRREDRAAHAQKRLEKNTTSQGDYPTSEVNPIDLSIWRYSMTFPDTLGAPSSSI